MAVEGRWTIARCACSVATVKGGAELPSPCAREGEITYVPVVPCDDAAVERAAKVLYAEGADGESWEDYAARIPTHANRYRDLAVTVLRAAGASDGS